MLRTAFVIAILSGGAAGVVAGVDPCEVSSTTSLFEAVRALQNPANGEAQRPGAAWTFRRGSSNGPLLTGNVCCSSPGFWATSGTSFNLPLLGPLVSPILAENQAVFADRPPTHAGVFFHPGNDANSDVFAVFAPERTVTITALTIRIEINGDQSDGMLLSAVVERSGMATTLLAPTLIPYTLTGNSVFNPTFSPMTLQAGDRLWIRGNLNGNPVEDWGNLNVELTLRRGPVQLAPPRSTAACVGQTAHFTCLAAGSPLITYHWRQNGEALEDGGRLSGTRTSVLSVANVQLGDEQNYDCIVMSTCGGFTSPSAFLDVVGTADMNCDGVVSVGDIAGFVLALTDPAAYAAQFPGCQLTNAEMNCDGQITVGDIGPFVTRLTGG